MSLCRKKTERSVTERHGDADQRENGLLKIWQKMDHIKVDIYVWRINNICMYTYILKYWDADQRENGLLKIWQKLGHKKVDICVCYVCTLSKNLKLTPLFAPGSLRSDKYYKTAGCTKKVSKFINSNVYIRLDYMYILYIRRINCYTEKMEFNNSWKWNGRINFKNTN